MAQLRCCPVEDLDDPALKPYRTLRRRKDLERQALFVAEGEKVVRRLLESPFPVASLLLTPDWLKQLEPLLAARPDVIDVFLAGKEQIEAITGFTCYQGVKAVGRIVDRLTLDALLDRVRRPWLLVALDGISNAENLGVIVRNAAALGAQGVVVGETSGSPFLTRAIRTSMGAIFRFPAVEVEDLAGALRALRARGVRCLAAHPPAERRGLAEVDLRADLCLVLGSEGYGLRPEVLAACDLHAAVPMAAGVDSLNVSSAAAVFCYEAARQRGWV